MKAIHIPIKATHRCTVLRGFFNPVIPPDPLFSLSPAVPMLNRSYLRIVPYGRVFTSEFFNRSTTEKLKKFARAHTADFPSLSSKAIGLTDTHTDPRTHKSRVCFFVVAKAKSCCLVTVPLNIAGSGNSELSQPQRR